MAVHAFDFDDGQIVVGHILCHKTVPRVLAKDSPHYQ
jgi:hypothetical protein